MRIGREHPVSDVALLNGLAVGKTPRVIAAEVGCNYETLRRRLSRHVRLSGARSVEHAVAVHIARRIRDALPLAVRNQVDVIARDIGL